MSSIVPAANYSFYAIPAFYVLIMAPQFYAAMIIRKPTDGKFDNANPRGEHYIQFLKKSLPRDTLGKYERARAAHSNGFESFPLFVAAVICGNMARLDPSIMNAVTGLYLALRTAYNVAYIQTTSQHWSVLRTGIWMSSVGCCLYLLGKAGTVMANGGPLAL